MSIKLKSKTFLFQGLDLMPRNLGFGIYHFFQKIFSSYSLAYKIKSNKRSFESFSKLTSKTGITVKEKRILEIGSGWLPLMPYYFKFLGGSKEVITIDLNCHYKPKAIRNLNIWFEREIGWNIIGEGQYFLPRGIKYFPNSDLTDLEKIEVDIVFSRYVLEHVSPIELIMMHKKLKLILKPGSFIIHFISPSDHRAYDDNQLSLQEFLIYSPEEWDKKQTKFDYHNRLRLPQYLDLFHQTGLEVVNLDYDIPGKESHSYKKFKSLKLHPDFLKFSEEELLAGSIQIVLKT